MTWDDWRLDGANPRDKRINAYRYEQSKAYGMYKRNYYPSRKPYASQPYKRPRQTSAPRASPRGFYGSVTRVKRAMLGLAEKKALDTVSGVFACDTTGTISLISGIATGNDYTMRIGRKTTITAVQMQGYVAPFDTFTNDCLCRIMLVWDKQPNGVLPAISAVLSQATSVSFINLDNRDRFRVISDTRIMLGRVDTTATQAFSSSYPEEFHIYKKVNLVTIYDGSSNLIGDINSGALYLLTIGSSAVGTGGIATVSTRIRFNDM